jgi:hypothetical protein
MREAPPPATTPGAGAMRFASSLAFIMSVTAPITFGARG